MAARCSFFRFLTCFAAVLFIFSTLPGNASAKKLDSPSESAVSLHVQQAGEGSISGTITSEEDGTGIECWIYAYPDGVGYYSGESDATGAYSLTALEPGDYILEFQPKDICGEQGCQPSEYLGEYYNDTFDYSEADLVHVGAGSSVTGISAQLIKGGFISGRVTASDGVTPIAGVQIYTTTTDESGYYRYGPLQAGSRTIRFGTENCSGACREYASEWYNDIYDWRLATPIEVDYGQTVTDINASLVVGGRISGTITDEVTGKTLPGIQVIAIDVVEDAWYYSDVTDSTGAYTIIGLPPSDIAVSFIESVVCDETGCTQPKYMMEFYDNEYHILDADRISVTAGTTISNIDAALMPVGQFSCGLVDEIPEVECEALVAIYNSTGGPGWINNNGWLSTTVISEWQGVYVEDGHVVAIQLYANGLTGSLPNQIGNLAQLDAMYLSGNNLTGSIPSSIGNLGELTLLYLGNNDLTSVIPAEIGNLQALRDLNLGFNQLTGSVPKTIGSLPNLRWLFLSNNHLTGEIPAELGNLSNLMFLYLDRNSLTGSIPTRMGDLANLSVLYLSNNRLAGGIPTSLSKLSNLVDLALAENELTGPIPAELGNLASLSFLDLSGNQLTGTIPSQLGNLSLYQLYLQDNQLSGDVPVELLNLGLIDPPSGGNEYLDLDRNYLNIPTGYPVDGNSFHSWLSSRDPQWHLSQSGQAVGSIPTTGGTITAAGGDILVTVPAGALTGETSFTITPLSQPSQSTGSMSFAGTSFQITAKNTADVPVTTFTKPLILTVHYTDQDISGLNENLLRVYYWNTQTKAWTDVVTTCQGGVYTRNLATNTLSVGICHLTEFALMQPGEQPSKPEYKTHIPMVRR